MSNSGGYLNILVSWLTSLFYTKSDIDTQIINNASYFSTYNATYHNNLDTNDTKTIQDMNASWLSTYNSTYASNINNASWNESRANILYANISFNYNQSNSFYNWLSSFVYNYNQTTPAITWANDTIQANNNSWMSTYNSTYANNIDTDTWKTNYTDYYNKTQIDTNFTFYYLASIINQILSGNITDAKTYSNSIMSGNLTSINNNINLNNTDAKLYANSIVASNDTWRSNHSNYYNKSQVDYNFSLITSSDSWKGNFSFYYNKSQVDNNFSLYYLNSNPLNFVNITTIGNSTIVHSGNYNCSGSNIVQNITINSSGIFSQCVAITSSDSWADNYSNYYNKTLIDNNFSLYYTKSQVDNNITVTSSTLYSNLSLYDLVNGSRSWTGNHNAGGYNISNIDNLTANKICNSTNCYTLYNFLLNNGGTDSWAGNYTFYYNKTLIDTNFSLYMLISSWNTNLTDINNNINNNLTSAEIYTNSNIAGNLTLTLLKNGSTTATGNFNFGGFNISGIDNLTSNKICNSTNCYNLNQFLIDTTSGTDTWSLNYTFYYNTTQVNLIVSSNDTWRTNYTNYPTKSDLYANLTGYLLINGSRAITGNLNLGGFNISNIDNLTSNRLCNSSTCYLLSDLLATSGSTYNETYHNYVTANISNETYNWRTSNNGTMSGINTTQMRNVNGILTILRDWWDGLYCQLTGCTMTGDLNMNGNNITNVKNISSDYYCNSTNCYTLVNFLTDTGSTDTWSLNYSFYYNKTLVDNNFSLYTPLTSLYANLTNYMLKNGSTTATGNFNFGGYNVSNIYNLTIASGGQIDFNSGGNITSNITCIKIRGSTSLLEIC